MRDQEDTALASEQRLLWRLITAPEGVRPALAQQRDPEGRRLGEVIRGDAILSAVDRLEVYANAYFFRILEVLAKDYPALQAAIGDARFHNLITDYLAARPPTRFSLRYAGEGLPAFIADDESAAATTARDDFPWAADLARLEWAIVDAFDAADPVRVGPRVPGVDRRIAADLRAGDLRPRLGREELARIPPDRWGELRFALDPSVRILGVRWPVNRIREAFDAERPLPSIAAAETALCVWRRDEQVFHRRLDPLEAACLGLVSEGATFGTLCERVALEIGEPATPARALTLLTGWVEGGLLSSLA